MTRLKRQKKGKSYVHSKTRPIKLKSWVRFKKIFEDLQKRIILKLNEGEDRK